MPPTAPSPVPATQDPAGPALKVLVLHGLWLAREGSGGPGLMLWAEGAVWRGRGRLHPFHASPDEIAEAIPALAGCPAVHRPLTLPAVGARPGVPGRPRPSHPLLQDALDGDIGKGGDSDRELGLAAWEVPGLLLESPRVLSWLLGLPGPDELRASGVLLGADIGFWRAAAGLAWDMLLGEHFLPGVVVPQDGAPARAAFKPLLDAPGVGERVARLAAAMPAACLAASLDAVNGRAGISREESVANFLSEVVDAEARLAQRQVAAAGREQNPHDAWLAALTRQDPELRLPKEESSALEQTLASWESRRQAACGGGLRAALRLKDPEHGVKKWTLEFLLQPLADPSLLVPASDVWVGSPASRKLAELGGAPEERLLAALALAGRVFAPIEAALKRARPEAVALDTAQAHKFLREAAPALAESGFCLLLPQWWKNAQAPKLGVLLDLSPRKSGGMMGLEAILDFNWKLALGDQVLTAAELESLAGMKEGLVRVRGQWVEADPEAVRKALAFWKAHQGAGLTLGEVFRRMREAESAGGVCVAEVSAHGWLKDLLGGPAAFKTLPTPADFAGKLRPYQERGWSWISFLSGCGLGACLADDMGLGKTIQTLVFLLHRKAAGLLEGPALLLCPTSVATNWEREAARFAPGLKVLVHHGADRRRSAASFRRQVRRQDLVISTYALARRDHELLGKQEWSGVILDEAQNIKNPAAAQSRAARALRGRFRIALTGTPVENRLAELWSIMEFLNPGFLGSFSDFEGRFALPIERLGDEAAARTLRRVTQPFVLRRLKTDPAIVPDLPEKIETKDFCALTREQVTLYQAVVDDMLAKIASSAGIERRGLVLSALTQLKQVLNHPAQFMKDRSALPGRSGKLERLTEMLEEALSGGDSALVFTQYAEMGALLKRHLQQTRLEEALFLHGGVPAPKRDEIVSRFQAGAPRVMVLTLKAGGVGLNLTRASHVFHYDRWWNPAVENQATDRAFRIGQTKRVEVHKFVCAGTLEDRIDALIESKKALAEKVLGAGEGWLTELSTAALRDLISLRREALE